jgi:transposase InsO family protein
MQEAVILIERLRTYYNTVRLHSSLDYRPPAPENWVIDISLKPDLTFSPKTDPNKMLVLKL